MKVSSSIVDEKDQQPDSPTPDDPKGARSPLLKKLGLDQHWQTAIDQDYKLEKILGTGSYGIVV